jgi:SpoIID/LytB domain protein
VYAGWDKEGGTDGDRWVAAVQATAGQIVSFDGHVALTVFSASDGGHTEDLNVQWGTPLSAYPYLAGVCDPGEYTPANPWTDWNRTFSAAKLTTLLATYTGDIGTVTAFVHIDRGVSGRIDRMEVSGSTGGATISGGELRTALGLPDDRVWINADKNVLGPIRVKYDALMCKPGLPTSVRTSVPGGSRQAFETGAIYRNAGIDLQVWLRGALYREYLDVGGATGRLGLPTSNPVAATAHRRAARCPTGCTRADFAGGAIFWKGGLGAFALWGRVLETYLGHGGPAGELGFPTSRLEAGNGATSATFEHGTIRCPASGNCRIS